MKKSDKLKFGETIVFQQNIDFIKSKILQMNIINGNVAEVGVYKGGSAKIISDILNPSTNLFLFDTFEGMPYHSKLDNFHEIGDFYDTSLDEVSNLFIGKNNVFLYKGIFPVETGKFVKNLKFDFVHLDVDQYESHILAMEFFYNKMVVGGCILLDDYNSSYCEGATIAVDEFLSDKKEKVQHAGNNVYYLIKE